MSGLDLIREEYDSIMQFVNNRVLLGLIEKIALYKNKIN